MLLRPFVALFASLTLSACILPRSAEDDGSDTVDDTGADDTGDTDDTDDGYPGSRRGQVVDGDFTLDWAFSSEWDGGACVEGTLTNRGPDVSDWRATVDVSPAISGAGWIDWGASGVLTVGEGQFVVEPGSQATWRTDGTSDLWWCSEPESRPTDLLMFATAVPVDTGNDDDEALFGSLSEPNEDFVLQYRANGTSNGGTCLELTLLNVATRGTLSFSPTITFDADTTVRDAWNLVAVDAGTNALLLYPGGDGVLAPRESWTGYVCLAPLVTPVSLTVSAVWGN